jgi:transketolase
MSEKGNLSQLSINTIRTLSMDAIQKANSGHPGAPMGMAPIAYELWQNHLNYNPEKSNWLNRDRFVLSAGHASMLLYSLLHLAGVKRHNGEPSVSLDDIKNFRQLGGVCPGHPESHLTAGVETTTGPLGQGVATSVGMAIAGRWMAENYNRPKFELFNHRVYALAGDGCLMEGISSEAASLAGHLQLGNLCWIYDSNNITIEGETNLAWSENVRHRFESYGWQVFKVEDANDLEHLKKAFGHFTQSAPNAKPTLVIVHSHIAFGAPTFQDTAKAHGSPLGDEEIALTKKNYGWPSTESFHVPSEVIEDFKQGIGQRGARLEKEWNELFSAYEKEYPKLAEEILKMKYRDLPADWDKDIEEFAADAKGIASRSSSGKVLNQIAKNLPWLMGGSADLAPSTQTLLKFEEAGGSFQAGNHKGRNLHFGIREHAMAAVQNGMTLSGLRAYGSSFLVFTDYARPAIRLSALMEVPSIHIYTHDSIGVGEDGPTHQPVEHLASLRAMPNLLVFRPADANEVVGTWRSVLAEKKRPSVLALSRQNLPTLDRCKYNAPQVDKGAYTLIENNANPEILLLASGSEVHLCLQAYEELIQSGKKVRVVSMPCWELFEEQSNDYKESVLPASVQKRVAVEAGVGLGWERYVGVNGKCLSIESFGTSAPGGKAFEHFGITANKVKQAAENL